MEQQKILWIIFSVAILLIVVLGAGFLWFFPSDSKSADGKEISALEEGDLDFDPIEWVRKSEEFPGLTEETVEESPDEFIIVYGESETGEETAAAGEDKESQPDEKIFSEPVVVKQVRKAEPAPPREEKAQPAAAVKKAKPKSERVREYWIQAGSYTSQDRAEQVKEALQEKGVVSRITSREIDGKTYFRVRIGPYQHSGEAEKFLEWIRGVNGFESSYVSQVYVTRKVN
jgi:DedD protein